MRFSLRTLLIIMLLAGPLCAFGWKEWQDYQAWWEQQRVSAKNKTGGGFMPLSVINMKLSTLPNPSAAEQEIWDQQKNNIAWESFPESQPGK